MSFTMNLATIYGFRLPTIFIVFLQPVQKNFHKAYKLLPNFMPFTKADSFLVCILQLIWQQSMVSDYLQFLQYSYNLFKNIGFVYNPLVSHYNQKNVATSFRNCGGAQHDRAILLMSCYRPTGTITEPKVVIGDVSHRVSTMRLEMKFATSLVPD